MAEPQFDSGEKIAGFPLLRIKHALTFVGLSDDGDDAKEVAQALSCPRSQAERVLVALDHRGLVTPTGVKNGWKKTELGRSLAFHWRPPPRIEPAIALDDEDSEAINEMFEEVPCSILRTAPNDTDAFEEARIEAGIIVDYESPRVVEISVAIPDDYDHPDGGALIESSVYLAVEDAKAFVKSLQTAIKRGEAELARRAAAKPRKKGASGKAVSRASAGALVLTPSPSFEKPKSGAAVARAAAAADAAERRRARAMAKGKRLEQRTLEATMKELRRGGKRKP